MFGGNRSGKTTAGGMEFLYHMTGMYPKWYPKEKRLTGIVKGRIIAKDFQKGVGEVIIPFLDEWLDLSLVKKMQKNPIGIAVKWILKNGNQFDILSHEQNTEQYEGWRGHIAWFDEPPPRDKYIATLRGLVDFRGRSWLTLTPLTQPWIYDDIYTKNDGVRIFCVVTDIRSNPHLSEEAIKEFEMNLTPEEKEARIHGKFLHLSGLIYKEFTPMTHICEPMDPKKNWTKYFCIDPHPRTPTACLWLGVDQFDNHWVYDELWLADMDLSEIAHAIHAQEAGHPAKIRFIDPAMDQANELAGGFNVRKELMKYGVFTQRASTDVMLGMQRVKQALTPKYNHQAGMEVPQLRIMSNCVQTIYEFNHYIWAERYRNKEEMDPKQQPKKKNDHFMDCLRYIYNAQPRLIVEEDDGDEEVEYAGKYAKYPVKKEQAGSYYSKVEAKF